MTVRKYIFLAGVVMYIYNSSTQETKAGGLWGQGQAGLYSEFQGNLGYIVRLCLKNLKTKQTKLLLIIVFSWATREPRNV
jgi:hypothetical protein